MSAWSKLFLHHNKATDRMTAANSYYSTQLHFVSGSGLPVTHVSMWAYCYVSMRAHFEPSPSKKFSVTVVLIIPYKYTLAELLWQWWGICGRVEPITEYLCLHMVYTSQRYACVCVITAVAVPCKEMKLVQNHNISLSVRITRWKWVECELVRTVTEIFMSFPVLYIIHFTPFVNWEDLVFTVHILSRAYMLLHKSGSYWPNWELICSWRHTCDVIFYLFT